MRILSTILLINILLLSISPQLSIPSFFGKKLTQKNCCTKPGKSEESTNDCCRYACNPFMACCNCSAVVTTYAYIAVPFHYAGSTYSTYSENHHAGFLSETWNPPKIG